ncbi:MAG: hypothetical protein QOJ60_2982 [Actinomycetota bacterium]|nr:hypothetical protein [Actinomycetota bacterium]
MHGRLGPASPYRQDMSDQVGLLERVKAHLRAMFDDRPVIVCGGPLAGLVRVAPQLRDLTSHRPLLLASGIGTGPLPGEDDAVVHVMPSETGDMMTSIRSMLARLADLPADALAAIEAYDPQCRAVVLPGAFFTGTEIAGRPVIEGRRPEWEALEDKTTVDALWDSLGVARPPSQVVPPRTADLDRAARVLDAGAGTVWSGDATEGFNGGAEYVRWVRSPDRAEEAAAFFAAHCREVRVVPFCEGLPCSIHGFAFPDGVAALRPVEMVVLRRFDDRFVYGGISTHWDPPDADREAMRDVARRTAVHLRDTVGYRGGFSVDGVLTSDGFLPTELNTRFSGGLGAISRGLPDFPLVFVQAALVSGHDPGIGAAEFERVLVDAADEHRYGTGASMVAAVAPTETETRPVVFDGDTVRFSAGAEAGGCAVVNNSHGADGGAGRDGGVDRSDEADGRLMLGPSPTGGYLRFEPRQDRIERGTSIGPLVSSAFALADAHWGTSIGATTPAREAGAAVTGGG